MLAAVRRVLTFLLVVSLGLPAAPARTGAGSCNERARQARGRMSLLDKVGQMVMAEVHAGPGGMPSASAREAIRRYRIGNVIVYERGGPRAAARHNNRLQRWARGAQEAPLLVAADFEFGTAHRVRSGTTAFPLAMAVGATRSTEDVSLIARVTAREARAMGFHWSLAPVADVNTNPRNPVIGVRSFGSKPGLVSRMVAAAVEAAEAEGAVATPKHFPGHGDTSVDSHTGLPVVGYSRRALLRRHLPPFRAAVDAGAGAIMTAHVVVRAVDPHRPATLSRKVLTGLLRKRLGFGGVIVTDAMTMDAIDRRWGTAEAARMAARAGADVIMATGTLAQQVETVRGLRDAVASGRLARGRVNAAALRILLLKCRLGLFDGVMVDADGASAATGRAADRQAATDLARRSVTMLRNRDVLPWSPATKRPILVAGAARVGALAAHVRRASAAPVSAWQSSGTDPSGPEIAEAVRRARDARRVVVATTSRGALPPGQARLVNALIDTGKPVVAVALGLPHDIASYPRAPAYLAAYVQGPWPHAIPAIRGPVDVIFGANPEGRLPVAIPRRFPFGAGRSY